MNRTMTSPVRRSLRRTLAFTSVAAVVTVAAAGSAGPVLAVGDPSGLPSVHCQFTEPFLDAVISPEGLVIEGFGQSMSAFAFQSANTLTGTYRFRSRGVTHVLEVLPGPGGDGMSDRTFAKVGRLDGQEGGCTEHPKGTLPRKVRGVADDDELNIRSRPSASASIVAAVPDGSWIFVKPGAGTWKRVAVDKTTGETGPVTSVSGYANAKFLTTKPAARH
jgi:uncharacterized membrane protein